MIFKIFVLCVLLLGSKAGVASEVFLSEFFTEVSTLKAGFEQRVEDETGAVLETTSGSFYLSRPGKFRWDYDSLDDSIENGQQIVADGEHLFFYDPDLEQVSKRSLKDSLGQVPSLLLVQSGANIEEHFNVVDYGVTDGLSWISLKPKDADAGYKQLMIGFDQGVIKSLLLYDGLGNTTRLDLLNVQSNVKIDASVFAFDVPEGADLLSE